MKRKTEIDLMNVLYSLEIISYQDDLNEEEQDVLYNLYGMVGKQLQEIINFDKHNSFHPDPDPDEFVK